MKTTFLCLILSFALPSALPAQTSSPLDALAIEVKDESREFSYTNKKSAFYYGETNAANTTGWQGFNVFGFEFLDDYQLLVNDEPLDRSTATTTVYPDYLVRTYPGGITEQLRLADSVALFAVIVTSTRAIELGVRPLFSDARSADSYEIRTSDGTISIARKHHLQQRDNTPRWLSIHGTPFSPHMDETSPGRQYSPGLLYARRNRTHMVSFAVSSTLEDAEKLARGYMPNAASYFRKRRARMEKLLNETHVQTENPRFDKALAWAKLSLDALIMNQRGKGIFAGLPWFNNYWGRDTFISLPGATLVTGQFAEAKAVLRSFAEFQERDSSSGNYGRIPNIVTTTEKAYNTADGTPRFVMMAREYVERSGDSSFVVEIYPVVLRSIEGALRYHVDSLGFLTHGDAETWMDAVGPQGPWSPRGNRANDIQALWGQQLEAGIWFATQLGDASSANRWNGILQKLRRSFAVHFIRQDGSIADHLKADGTHDHQLRPNQVFTVSLLGPDEREGVLRSVTNKLTYEHGVASLWQGDEDFHPYHQYGAYYPKDAAYHNGIVWTWLQGALISELCATGNQELAYRVTANTVHQILNRGAVGTQSELLDAAPRPGKAEPRLSGTFSQAWNLAEFIRNFYDDYLGVRVSIYNHRLVLRPMLPRALGKVNASINLGGRTLPIAVDMQSEPQTIVIDAQSLRRGGPALVEFPNDDGRIIRAEFNIPPQSTVRVQHHSKVISLYVNGDREPGVRVSEREIQKTTDLSLATPAVAPKLRSLRGPDYPLLSNGQIRMPQGGLVARYATSDPEGDDVGAGAYTYPNNPAFIAGCFDITAFEVSYDEANVFFKLRFRALSDPGWHPEYGFQLTYVAIAIDQDGIPGSGKQHVEHNANFTLNREHAYEKLILVGGGLRIEDERGNVIAAYVPVEEDISHPLGNAGAAEISFALPLEKIGRPESGWTFTVLVGAQDDHGGAGLGEFRTVNETASEWNGGGRLSHEDPNVYDTLVLRIE